MRVTKTVLFLLGLMTICLVFKGVSPALADDELGKVGMMDRRVAMIVAQLMQQDHLSTRKLDDEISRRAFDMYIRGLDPQKMYFMQSDIDEFTKFPSRRGEVVDFRSNMGMAMEDGDYTIAFVIFKRFLDRLDERVKTVNELLGQPMDFTMDEQLTTDREAIEWATSDEEIRDRWRKRLKYSLLVLKFDDADDAMGKDPKERLRKRYRSFANRMHQYDNEDVIEMFITAITTSFDPHTSYMSSRSFENFMINMRLKLEGIGATLSSEDDGLTKIRRIVPGGAADKHGKIKVGDKIVAVGQGDEGEMNDITDMKLDLVVDQIRGKAGTTVRLSVMNSGTNEINTYSIVREQVELKDSDAKGVVFEEGTKADGTPFKIGMIDLPSFYADMESAKLNLSNFKSTTRDVKRILEDFNKQSVDAVVLDLRRNGGGSLREAVDCTGLFIDRGPVVQIKDAYGQIDSLRDEYRGTAWEGPLVVLTSKFSASASEILAGAVQDYRRGLVVGDKATHGKGTVQNMLDLDQALTGIRSPKNRLGALKITMQQFYRPSGDSTQKRGVLADVVLPSISDQMDVGEADLDYPVEFDRVNSARFQSLGLVSPETVKYLSEQSAQRRTENEDFQRLERNVKRYVEQKDRKFVTLNEEKFLAQRKEFNADKEDEKTIEDQVNHTNDDIVRNFYLDEVFRITKDFATKSDGNPIANN